MPYTIVFDSTDELSIAGESYVRLWVPLENGAEYVNAIIRDGNKVVLAKPSDYGWTEGKGNTLYFATGSIGKVANVIELDEVYPFDAEVAVSHDCGMSIFVGRDLLARHFKPEPAVSSGLQSVFIAIDRTLCDSPETVLNVASL